MIHFTKVQSSGNDYILVDPSSGWIPQPHQAVTMCDRHHGIGADGMILLSEYLDGWAFRLIHPNGSEGAISGNGLRCAAFYVMQREGGSECTLYSGIGAHRAAKTPLGISVVHPLPRCCYAVGDGFFIDVGTIHFIQLRPNLDDPHFEAHARILSQQIHPSDRGVNVSSITSLSDGSLLIRTYEQALDRETRACGTAAIASGYLIFTLYGQKETTVQFLQESPLHVSIEADQTILSGRVTAPFYGVFDPNSISVYNGVFGEVQPQARL